MGGPVPVPAGLDRSIAFRMRARCDAYAGTLGGIAFVYVTDPARRAEVVPKLKDLFARTAGIERVLDVAPTIARLLGIALPSAEGRPMEEILTAQP